MQHRFRGIAQLVEQRSPKPRAVSSKLTTPSMTHRFFGTCAFGFFTPSATSASFMALTGNFAATAKSRPLGEGGCDQREQTEGVFTPLLQKIAFSANLCLTTGRLSDIIEHVPAVRRRTNLSDHGPVAQLVRAPACHAGGRRFEPDPGRHLLL